MAINLTKEEKAQIISSHIKSLSYTKYNLEIDIIQESAQDLFEKNFWIFIFCYLLNSSLLPEDRFEDLFCFF